MRNKKIKLIVVFKIIRVLSIVAKTHK